MPRHYYKHHCRMQNGTSSPKPVRSAKTIANIKLLGHDPSQVDATLQPRPSEDTPVADPAGITNPTGGSPQVPHTETMDGVATQTDPAQTPDVQVAPAANPKATPDPKRDETIADLRNMIKELNDKVDRNAKAKSRSRSNSTRRSRRRRSSSRDRRYSPSSERGSTRARRSSTGRRRSPSRGSSRRRSHTPRRRSRTRSTSRRRDRSHRSSSSRHSLERPTQPIQGEITTALAAQYPTMGTHKGKRLPVTGLTLKPYRCLPPDLRNIARDRRSRRDLTFPEHMCGLIKMISTALDPASEAYAALQHAADVAQDAASLPWPAVRQWTHSCMAYIEDRKASWYDTGLFTNDRTRLSWIAGRQMAATRRYPCPQFNMGKCDDKATHSAEGTTWTHVCALCLHITGQEKSTHGASTCRLKNQGKYYDDHRSDSRPKGQPNKARRDRQDQNQKN